MANKKVIILKLHKKNAISEQLMAFGKENRKSFSSLLKHWLSIVMLSPRHSKDWRLTQRENAFSPTVHSLDFITIFFIAE